MAALFNRKDVEVKKYAEELTQEEFLERYKGQTTDTVLRSVWKDYNKQAKVTKQIVEQTQTAVDLPEPEVEEEEETPPPPPKKKAGKKPTAETDDRTNPLVNAARGRDKSGVNKDEVKKPTTKKEPAKEESATPTRATRMRALIEAGKDKPTVKELLIKEGYEVGASFHSEWNRISKK